MELEWYVYSNPALMIEEEANEASNRSTAMGQAMAGGSEDIDEVPLPLGGQGPRDVDQEEEETHQRKMQYCMRVRVSLSRRRQ